MGEFIGEDKAEHLADLYLAVDRYFKETPFTSSGQALKTKREKLEVWAINNGYTRQELREMKLSFHRQGVSK